MPTGSEGLVLRGTGSKFISNRGKPFRIEMTDNGFYHIIQQNGGKAPRICDELYTSYSLAEKALTLYLQKNDRLGFAEYPSKDK